jgi:uncharacterized membrane protein
LAVAGGVIFYFRNQIWGRAVAGNRRTEKGQRDGIENHGTTVKRH